MRVMIYNIPYETEEIFNNSFSTIRNIMNSEVDTLNIILPKNQVAKAEVYKQILYLEGMYRTSNQAWGTRLVIIKVVYQA